MRAVGTKPDHATSLADNLVMADYRGHFSHGLNRLGQHIYLVPFITIYCLTIYNIMIL